MSRFLGLCVCCLLNASPALAEGDASIWCREPAQAWEAALPLGNGRMGAMVFGSAPVERIQFNEETLWAGRPFDVYPENFRENLSTLQRLILDGDVLEAELFGLERMTGEPTSFRSYEPVADLWVELDHGPAIEDYRRRLDLRNGIVEVAYRAGAVLVKREVLISAVDDVVAVRLSADRPAGVRCRIRLTRAKDVQVTARDGGRLNLDGQIVDIPAPGGYDDNPGGSGPGGEHMRFAGRLLARPRGGTIAAEQDVLAIDGADEVILLFTAATDFNLERMNFDRSIDPGLIADRILDRAARRSWEALLRDHLAEHRLLFDRVSLDLGDAERDALPTDERLAAVKQGGDDPGLVARYYQFGRYLLMSSSRQPGRVPANLQGIWNAEMWAPWESDYHLNINLQMNYWPADPGNLPETVGPLVDWFERVCDKGRVSARKLYGANGWVAFTAVDLFGRTTPAGSTRHSQFVNGVLDPLAGAWMAMTLWDHYLFNRDETFLRDRAYPILKGAAEFLLDYLIEDRHGRLTIVPSASPENSYIEPSTGRGIRVTQGSAYHLTVARAVFEAVIRSSTILAIDVDFRGSVEKALGRLAEVRVGSEGRLLEWHENYAEQQPGHRHMSHLLGLHPFAQITPHTPKLFEAARRAVRRRMDHGGGHTGWSRAWLISMQARLLDGDAAREHLMALVRSGKHPNFFGADSVFQIDAHFAAAAGIAEMLLQSHAGEIHLLPALPKAWPAGQVRGLKARGGFAVDIDWREGKVTDARIRSLAGGTCRVRCALPLDVLSATGERLEYRCSEKNVIEFSAQAGGLYELRSR